MIFPRLRVHARTNWHFPPAWDSESLPSARTKRANRPLFRRLFLHGYKECRRGNGLQSGGGCIDIRSLLAGGNRGRSSPLSTNCALLACRLRPERPCGEKETPMLAELVLFSIVVMLLFSPAVSCVFFMILTIPY